MPDDDSSLVTTAVTMAVLQTTQSDHERRIAVLEANFSRMLFWLVAGTCSSFATLAMFVVTHFPAKTN